MEALGRGKSESESEGVSKGEESSEKADVESIEKKLEVESCADGTAEVEKGDKKNVIESIVDDTTEGVKSDKKKLEVESSGLEEDAKKKLEVESIADDTTEREKDDKKKLEVESSAMEKDNLKMIENESSGVEKDKRKMLEVESSSDDTNGVEKDDQPKSETDIHEIIKEKDKIHEKGQREIEGEKSTANDGGDNHFGMDETKPDMEIEEPKSPEIGSRRKNFGNFSPFQPSVRPPVNSPELGVGRTPVKSPECGDRRTPVKSPELGVRRRLRVHVFEVEQDSAKSTGEQLKQTDMEECKAKEKENQMMSEQIDQSGDEEKGSSSGNLEKRDLKSGDVGIQDSSAHECHSKSSINLTDLTYLNKCSSETKGSKKDIAKEGDFVPKSTQEIQCLGITSSTSAVKESVLCGAVEPIKRKLSLSSHEKWDSPVAESVTRKDHQSTSTGINKLFVEINEVSVDGSESKGSTGFTNSSQCSSETKSVDKLKETELVSKSTQEKQFSGPLDNIVNISTSNEDGQSDTFTKTDGDVTPIKRNLSLSFNNKTGSNLSVKAYGKSQDCQREGNNDLTSTPTECRGVIKDQKESLDSISGPDGTASSPGCEGEKLASLDEKEDKMVTATLKEEERSSALTVGSRGDSSMGDSTGIQGNKISVAEVEGCDHQRLQKPDEEKESPDKHRERKEKEADEMSGSLTEGDKTAEAYEKTDTIGEPWKDKQLGMGESQKKLPKKKIRLRKSFPNAGVPLKHEEEVSAADIGTDCQRKADKIIESQETPSEEVHWRSIILSALQKENEKEETTGTPHGAGDEDEIECPDKGVVRKEGEVSDEGEYKKEKQVAEVPIGGGKEERETPEEEENMDEEKVEVMRKHGLVPCVKTTNDGKVSLEESGKEHQEKLNEEKSHKESMENDEKLGKEARESLLSVGEPKSCSESEEENLVIDENRGEPDLESELKKDQVEKKRKIKGDGENKKSIKRDAKADKGGREKPKMGGKHQRPARKSEKSSVDDESKKVGGISQKRKLSLSSYKEIETSAHKSKPSEVSVDGAKSSKRSRPLSASVDGKPEDLQLHSEQESLVSNDKEIVSHSSSRGKKKSQNSDLNKSPTAKPRISEVSASSLKVENQDIEVCPTVETKVECIDLSSDDEEDGSTAHSSKKSISKICKSCRDIWNDNILYLIFKGTECVTVNSKITYGAIVCINDWINRNLSGDKEQSMTNVFERADLGRNIAKLNINKLDQWLDDLLQCGNKNKCCDVFTAVYGAEKDAGSSTMKGADMQKMKVVPQASSVVTTSQEIPQGRVYLLPRPEMVAALPSVLSSKSLYPVASEESVVLPASSTSLLKHCKILLQNPVHVSLPMDPQRIGQQGSLTSVGALMLPYQQPVSSSSVGTPSLPFLQTVSSSSVGTPNLPFQPPVSLASVPKTYSSNVGGNLPRATTTLMSVKNSPISSLVISASMGKMTPKVTKPQLSLPSSMVTQAHTTGTVASAKLVSSPDPSQTTTCMSNNQTRPAITPVMSNKVTPPPMSLSKSKTQPPRKPSLPSSKNSHSATPPKTAPLNLGKKQKIHPGLSDLVKTHSTGKATTTPRQSEKGQAKPSNNTASKKESPSLEKPLQKPSLEKKASAKVFPQKREMKRKPKANVQVPRNEPPSDDMSDDGCDLDDGDDDVSGGEEGNDRSEVNPNSTSCAKENKSKVTLENFLTSLGLDVDSMNIYSSYVNDKPITNKMKVENPSPADKKSPCYFSMLKERSALNGYALFTFDLMLYESNNHKVMPSGKGRFVTKRELLTLQSMFILNADMPDVNLFYQIFIQILLSRKRILLVPDSRALLVVTEDIRKEYNRAKSKDSSVLILNEDWDPFRVYSAEDLWLEDQHPEEATHRDILSVFCTWKNLEKKLLDQTFIEAMQVICKFEEPTTVDQFGLCLKVYARFCRYLYEENDVKLAQSFLNEPFGGPEYIISKKLLKKKIVSEEQRISPLKYVDSEGEDIEDALERYEMLEQTVLQTSLSKPIFEELCSELIGIRDKLKKYSAANDMWKKSLAAVTERKLKILKGIDDHRTKQLASKLGDIIFAKHFIYLTRYRECNVNRQRNKKQKICRSGKVAPSDSSTRSEEDVPQHIKDLVKDLLSQGINPDQVINVITTVNTNVNESVMFTLPSEDWIRNFALGMDSQKK